MIGQHLVELFQSFRVELFYGPTYLFMNLLSPFEKQAVIGNLLSEGVFKDVFQLREKSLLVDELESLEV